MVFDMIHNMKLNDRPYNDIYFGNKDIEMRLYDDKRKLINVGDTITFTNIMTLDSFNVKVINLHRYNSFEDLYKFFDKKRLGYYDNETANCSDMEKYYTKDDIAKYGVIGIEIKKL